jgi:hypothetical protein
MTGRSAASVMSAIPDHDRARERTGPARLVAGHAPDDITAGASATAPFRGMVGSTWCLG